MTHLEIIRGDKTEIVEDRPQYEITVGAVGYVQDVVLMWLRELTDSSASFMQRELTDCSPSSVQHDTPILLSSSLAVRVPSRNGLEWPLYARSGQLRHLCAVQGGRQAKAGDKMCRFTCLASNPSVCDLRVIRLVRRCPSAVGLSG